MNNKSMNTGLRVPREVLTKDLVAGLVMSIVNVPGALANGLLAGLPRFLQAR
jgi:MFS superfamily sulfate permease-like transporter